MHIGDGHFGGRNEEAIIIGHAECVLFKFRKLTGAAHGVAVDHERRKNLGVTVICVGIQIIVDYSTLQTGAHATVEMESGAGHFGGSIRIQNAKIFSEIPMGFGVKIKFTGRAPTPHFHIFAVILADRNQFVGQIRDGEQKIGHFGINRSDFVGIRFHIIG